VEPPNFTTVLQAGSRREWALLAVLAGLGLGAAGYKTQEQWLPRLLALARRAPSAPAEAPAAPAIGLSAVDSGGQLMIRWDHNSPIVRTGTGGLLMISDGGAAPLARALEVADLQAGFLTYARQYAQVDVMLTIHRPDGTEVREVATYLGQAPVLPPPPVADEAQKQLQTDLEKQAIRTKNQKKRMEDLRLEMRRKRMDLQIPDAEKKAKKK